MQKALFDMMKPGLSSLSLPLSHVTAPTFQPHAASDPSSTVVCSQGPLGTRPAELIEDSADCCCSEAHAIRKKGLYVNRNSRAYMRDGSPFPSSALSNGLRNHLELMTPAKEYGLCCELLRHGYAQRWCSQSTHRNFTGVSGQTQDLKQALLLGNIFPSGNQKLPNPRNDDNSSNR